MFLLALSCLQGRPMEDAAKELIKLPIDGLQLTPGNAPTEEFAIWLSNCQIKTTTHQGFMPNAYKGPVWDDNGYLICNSDSVHPPKLKDANSQNWRQIIEKEGTNTILEVMYPGYRLGTAAEIEWAMYLKIPLAVDISHLYIQQKQNQLNNRVLRRLFEYENICEVHISSNNGCLDSHQPITKNTFGLDWAKERLTSGTTTVLECYMHRLSQFERVQQIELINT